MERNIDTDQILELFYDSFRIPAGIFDEAGNLTKLYFACGRRIMKMYLQDAGEVLAAHGTAGRPELVYDPEGSGWCILPFREARILAGPVQTGRNPAFPYESIPEHTWSGFRNICRFVSGVLYGQNTEVTGNESAYAETFTADRMIRQDQEEGELKSFDDLFLCVAMGDMKNLDRIMHSGSFFRYLDQVMTDRTVAKTIFQFNLAKTYHSAQQSQVPINDLVPLVDMYLTESSGYRSLAAYKSGMQRMLYDFTRYVGQYKNDQYSPLVNQAVMYIRENIYKMITVEEIADRCMVSLSTLQHRFREETGMSVKEKIRRSKMERACFFLKNTDLSCGDIAYRMGYGSQSYFIKQFGAATGMTPAEYRKASSQKFVSSFSVS